ncbi:class I SAM-dependent methyltransferase [Clostridium aminobutyricum]|uniref:Class I SAM-dependent methyltransferase n=1 Tax=Clostridium aminobutyricum TaxID=33953 RepID=A0A939DAT4_CLOAM|nr:class I SAM-dependent methyltransferase [Clostridium aminobutyricum]MBN7774275.1 class I SAM-dependent methyltransferase [Clostridium aminobutyricum]
MLLLNGVQETMLIPLAIKASETKRDNARIQDPMAVEIVGKLGIDISKYDKFMSHEGVVARTILFDDALKHYIKKYPNAACVSIGCGFDARFSRVDNGEIIWYDLDFEDVITARKQFFPEQDRVHLVAKSALDATWPLVVEKRDQTIILIEGMLMYLKEEEVKQLFQIIKDHFKNVTVLAELMSPYAAKGSKHHDTVKYTKATFKWGVKSGKEVEKLCDGLKLIDEKSFNCEMKKYSLRGKIFAAVPGIRNINDRIAVFTL